MSNKLIFISIIIILSFGIVEAQISCHNMTENHLSDEMYNFKVFLMNDQTSEQEYTQYYQCSHFTRDLRDNASKQNITLYGVLLSTHPTFQEDGHAACLVIINNEPYIVESVHDTVYDFKDYYRFGNQYIKIYTNGNVPARFTGHRTPDIDMKKFNTTDVLTLLS